MSTIKVRRGTQAELDSVTLEDGEMGYTTDTDRVYIGDGSGNLLVGSTDYHPLNGDSTEDFAVKDLTATGAVDINPPTAGGALIVGTQATSSVDSYISIAGARTASSSSDIAALKFQNDTANSYTMGQISGRDPVADDAQKDGILLFKTGNNGSLVDALNIDQNQDARFKSNVILDNTAGHYFQHGNSSTHDKFRVWDGANYTIGMASGQTWGHINSYAMSFTMANTVNFGWLWRTSADASSEGQMSLSNVGELSVKKNISIGTTGTECTIEFNATESSIDFIID